MHIYIFSLTTKCYSAKFFKFLYLQIYQLIQTPCHDLCVCLCLYPTPTEMFSGQHFFVNCHAGFNILKFTTFANMRKIGIPVRRRPFWQIFINSLKVWRSRSNGQIEPPLPLEDFGLNKNTIKIFGGYISVDIRFILNNSEMCLK